VRGRYWGLLGGVAALILLAAGAFVAWGPVGFGDGPLSVAFVASGGTVPQTAPTMVLIPVQADAGTRAVIDAVGITGGNGSPPPELLQVTGDTSQACGGIWYPVTGSRGFRQHCAPHGTVPLLGHVVPRRPASLLAADGQGTAPGARGIDIAIQVSPPGSSGCWSIGKVAVHYHVGGRHYTAVARESLTGCNAAAQLAPDGADSSTPPAPGSSSSSPAVSSSPPAAP
jgi:hypothetical protein